MFCQNCGRQIPDGIRFCGHCGAEQGVDVPPQQPQQPQQQPPQQQTGYVPQQPQQPGYAPQQPGYAPQPNPSYTPAGTYYGQGSQVQPKEKVFAGFLGALLGSLAGVAVMILLDQLGVVAALSGLVMAFCALWGYQKLAGRLSIKGIVISVLVLIVMVYVGFNFAWGFDSWLVAYKNRDSWGKPTSLWLYVKNLDSTLDAVPALREQYQENLVLQYVFAAVGAIPMIIRSVKDNKKQ